MFYIEMKTRGLTAQRRALNLILSCALLLSLVEPVCPGSLVARAQKTSKPTAQPAKPSEVLKLNQPVERQLSKGETHYYAIRLTDGDYVRVVADTSRARVTLTFASTPKEGAVTAARNSDNANHVETLSAIVFVTGTYTIAVSLMFDDLGGPYSISIAELRPATDKDKTRLKAESISAEGDKLLQESSLASLKSAINKFNEAVTLWHELDDQRQEARVLARLGDSYRTSGLRDDALASYQKSLVIAEKIGDPRFQLARRYDIARIYQDKDDYKSSVYYLSGALDIAQKTNDSQGEAAILSELGMNFLELGDQPRAADFSRRSLAVLQQKGSPSLRAQTLVNLGLIYLEMDEPLKAIDHLKQALTIYRSILFSTAQASVLHSIGNIYLDLGDNQNALENYLQALALFKTVETTSGQILTLISIGAVSRNLSDTQKALGYYGQALELARASKDQAAEAQMLNLMGDTHLSLNDTKSSLDIYNQALPLATATKDQDEEMKALAGLGKASFRLSDIPKAYDYYKKALFLSVVVNDQSSQANILFNIARLELSRGNLPESRTQCEAAIKLFESLYSSTKTKSFRRDYSATLQDCYRLYIAVLMGLHKADPGQKYDELALQVAERARFQIIAEELNDIRGNIRENAESVLIERQQALRRELNSKVQCQLRLLNNSASKQSVEGTKREINSLLTELKALEAQIRVKSSRYSSMAQSQVPSLNKIQQMLDSDSLLLEYSLGDERSYLWAITFNSMTSYELPKRSEIEKAASKVYQLISARTQSSSLARGSAAQSSQLRVEAEYWKAASALNEMILKPLALPLRQKRLIVVADGALQYIPFAALPNPIQMKLYVPLILDYEIVSLPAVTSFLALKREFDKRKPANKTLIMLADPVLEADDSRVKRPGTAPALAANVGLVSESQKRPPTPDTKPGLCSSVVESNFRFPKLPFAKQEARQILSLFPLFRRRQAFDFDASRATATSSELSEYRLIHFATHAFIDDDHPELSGIVLSLVNKQGAQQDGILFAQDIYNANLFAELVVLSGCQTALEKQIKGEGLTGITQSFMYAGVSRVVGSLWNIDDEATAQLMTSFYRHMLEEDLRPAAALRRAQIDILRSQRWNAPYYWAAFVLQGEWR